jgi:ABC-type lipoprotein export system ATPase subunit
MILKIANLTKRYGNGLGTPALNGINLEIEEGEFIGIMGPSGSGKTTLLNLIATIDNPTTGKILINGTQPGKMSDSKMASFRRNNLGIVFQGYNLIDSLSVKENIALPMILENRKVDEIEKRVGELADFLGIKEILEKHPYEISGGEGQRTAIGRAVVNRPSLLLADEPTGNLDSKSSAKVMELFTGLNAKERVTTLLVTHDPFAASYCKTVLFIRDGKLYNKITKGESQKEFFNDILEVLSYLNSTQEESL